MKHRKSMMLLTAMLLLSIQAGAEPARYEIAQGSEVVFESKAPLDSFKGRTGELGGWFVADLSDPDGLVQLEVQVVLASFDTGIGKRNQHMRDNHLETDTYQLAWFRGGTVTEVGTEDGKTRFTLDGEMDLHGVVQPLSCLVEIQPLSDGTAKVVTDFVIKLSDYDIKRPKFLVMKLADEQKVRVEPWFGLPQQERLMNRAGILVVVMGVLALSGCTDRGADPVDLGPVTPPSISFATQVQPIFNTNCTGCHGVNGNGGLDLRDGESYGNLVGVDSAGGYGIRVVKGNPDTSVLHRKLNALSGVGGPMPPTGLLSQTDRNTIAQWILNGADEN